MIFDKITSLFKKGLNARPQLEDDTKREELFWQLLAEQFRNKNLTEHQDYWVKTPKEDFPIFSGHEKRMHHIGESPRRLLLLRENPAVNYVHLESVRRGFNSLDEVWGKCYLTHCDAYIGKLAEKKVFLKFDAEGNPMTHPWENKVKNFIREVFDMDHDTPFVFDYEKFCEQCDILHLNTRIDKMLQSNDDLSMGLAYGY